MLNLLGSFSAYSSKLIETKKIISDCNQNVKNIHKTTGIYKISRFKKSILIKDIYDLLLKEAMNKIDINPVGVLVCTQTPDESIPALSSQFVFRNKLENVKICLDINAGCTGFVDVSRLASMYLRKSKFGHVLCFTGDISSRIIDYNDYSLSCVFGDLINLSVYEYKDSSLEKEEYSEFVCPKYNLSIQKKENSFLEMNGLEVMSFVGSTVIPKLEKFLLKISDTGNLRNKTLILHQANDFIIKFINKKIKNKFQDINLRNFTMSKIGNSSSSTIPFAISKYAQDNLLDKDLVLCGFGVGMKVSLGKIKVSNSASFGDLIL